MWSAPIIADVHTVGPAESFSRKAIQTEIEGTVNRLNMNHFEIYYIHGLHEPSPIKETLSALTTSYENAGSATSGCVISQPGD